MLAAAAAAGEVCLFNCIEWLREQLQQWQDAAAAAALAADLQDNAALHDGHEPEASNEEDGAAYSDDYDDGELDTELQHLPESQGRVSRPTYYVFSWPVRNSQAASAQQVHPESALLYKAVKVIPHIILLSAD